MVVEVAAPADLFDLSERVAVVTGASAGLGDRFVRVLHAAGATVVAAARREGRLAALARELGERIVPVRCDVAVDDDCAALAQAALDVAGRIDVLVNNAGTSAGMAAEDEPPENFRREFDVNVHGLFVLSQAVGRLMLVQGRGSIINIASVVGLVGSAPLRQASYCASKGAVVNLTRELACQWARKGVRVNAIAPAWFPSDMTTVLIEDDAARGYVERNTPMGRLGESHELDGTLLLLASDASTYLTGQIIAVDGGWTAR